MKKLIMAVVVALAAVSVMADEPQRGPRRHHGERRAQFDRMPPPMMMYGSGAMLLRMLSSKMGLERIGVTEEAQVTKLTDAFKPLMEESGKLDGQIRELTRAQSQALSALLKDKASDPKVAMDKVGEIEKLRAEQGRLAVKAVLVLRENLTPEQLEKAGTLFSGRGMRRPGGMGPGGERRRPRPNGGERPLTPPSPADKPAAAAK